MRLLAPVQIGSLTMSSAHTPNLSYPVSNLLLAEPEVYFAVTTGELQVELRVFVTGTFDSFVLLGVQSLAGVASVLDDSFFSPPGRVVESYADPYRVGRRNYWMRFTPITTAGQYFRILIQATAGQPAEVIRAGVLMCGLSSEHAGLLYPLAEASEDPTPVVQMADGSIYRSAQLPVRRIFSATMRAARTDVETFVDTCRRTQGVPTMMHLAPTMGDRYFVYGRMTTQPAADHSWPVVSNASFSVQEWV